MVLPLTLLLCLVQPDYYDLRMTFSEKISEVKSGMSESQVLSLAGEPTRRVAMPLEPHPGKTAWYYCDRPGRCFPNLGTVYFNDKGVVQKCFGIHPPSQLTQNTTADIPAFMDRISASAGLTRRTFDSFQTWAIARDLAALGRVRAGMVLQEYLSVQPINADCGTYMGIPNLDFDSRLGANTGKVWVLANTLLDESSRQSTGNAYGVFLGFFDIDLHIIKFFEGVPVVLTMGTMPCDLNAFEQDAVSRLLDPSQRLAQFPVEPPSGESVFGKYIDWAKASSLQAHGRWPATSEGALEVVRKQLGLGP